MKHYKISLQLLRQITEEHIRSVEANNEKEAEHKAISEFRKLMEGKKEYDDVIKLSVASKK